METCAAQSAHEIGGSADAEDEEEEDEEEEDEEEKAERGEASPPAPVAAVASPPPVVVSSARGPGVRDHSLEDLLEVVHGAHDDGSGAG